MRLFVIKIGTNSALHETRAALHESMTQIAHDISRYQTSRDDMRFVIVSSGAVGMGRRLDPAPVPRSEETLIDKQVLASIGQAELVTQWNRALPHLRASQFLLTRDDLSDGKRRQNTLNAFCNAFARGTIVPIINENDTTVTTELQYTDNDELALEVAKLIGAEKLIILTESGGIYDSDPRVNPEAALYNRLSVSDRFRLESLKGASSEGRGGIASKINVSFNAAESGITAHIACPKRTGNLLTRIIFGNAPGTTIAARAPNLASA